MFFSLASFVDIMHRLSRRKSTNLGRLLFLAFWSLIVINIGATTVFAITSMANYPGGAALTQFTQSYSPEKGVYSCMYKVSYLMSHPGRSLEISTPLHVHMSNLAAQTGASLFLQVHAPPFPSPSLVCPRSEHSEPPQRCFYPVYDKSENMTLEQLTGSREVTHLISEWSPLEMQSRSRVWRVLSPDGDDVQVKDVNAKGGVISAYAGWEINWEVLNAMKRMKLGDLGKTLMDKGLVWMRNKPVLWIYERR